MMKRVFLVTMMIAFAGIANAQTLSYVPEMESEIKGSAMNEKEYKNERSIMSSMQIMSLLLLKSN